MSSPYIEMNPVAGVWVIELRLPEELDLAAFDEIHRTLLDGFPSAPMGRFVVDLSKSKYVGSMLLGLLINIRQKVTAQKGRLVVCGMGPSLLRATQSSRLTTLLTIVPTRAEALETV